MVIYKYTYSENSLSCLLFVFTWIEESIDENFLPKILNLELVSSLFVLFFSWSFLPLVFSLCAFSPWSFIPGFVLYCIFVFKFCLAYNQFLDSKYLSSFSNVIKYTLYSARTEVYLYCSNRYLFK